MFTKLLTNPTILKLIFRHLLTALGGYIVTKGILSGTQWEDFVGSGSVIFATVLSVWDKRALIVADLQNLEKNITSGAAGLLLLVGASCALTGCTSIVNNPQGKIVSVTTRVLGVDIAATDTTSETPHVYLGFVSQNVTLEPTSTNALLSPNFANTFGDTSTSLLDWGINESLASGNYETLASGATNSAATTIPVLPK